MQQSMVQQIILLMPHVHDRFLNPALEQNAFSGVQCSMYSIPVCAVSALVTGTSPKISAVTGSSPQVWMVTV